MLFEKKGLFLEIHHYNYDWPNKPSNNKIILYLSNVKDIDPNIIQMIGECIIDCCIEDANPKLNITFVTRTFRNNKPVNFEIKPLEFEKMYIQEKS